MTRLHSTDGRSASAFGADQVSVAQGGRRQGRVLAAVIDLLPRADAVEQTQLTVVERIPSTHRDGLEPLRLVVEQTRSGVGRT